MNQDINRLLMALEQNMREINHEIINPQITELTLDDLRPVLCTVANARARYLKALFDLGAKEEQTHARPGEQEFAELRQLRLEFDELMSGAQALEAAIQRGYLDVIPNKN